MDPATSGFMLIATSLVMLMTPGLAFFYGGLVGKKNVLSVMVQSFISMGWTTVLWVTFGFSMCFGDDLFGIIGDGKYLFLSNITPTTAYNASLPLYIVLVYQMMFAVITPALITGAFAERIHFKAYMIFLTVWEIFVYFPAVHMVWGGGLFQQMGILDFAGGIVVHATAGFAALASVFFVGKRKVKDVPHNLPMVALGTGLLWFGWYGFNAGSELAVNEITVLAFLNTDVAASFAAVTWLLITAVKEGKPKVSAVLTGAAMGLVTITPAAGFVTVQVAMLIGIISSFVGYYAIEFKNKRGWDDALDVWGVHGMGGYVGILLLGLFATTSVNGHGANGLLYGNPLFFVKEFAVVTGVAIYAFVFTYVALWLIDRFTQVRVTADTEENGLDMSEFGEIAYP